MYKSNILILTGLTVLFGCGDGKQASNSEHLFDVTIVNASDDTLRQYPVELDLVRVDENFHLKMEDQDIPVQIEDRNQNDRPDKMFTLVDLLPSTTIKLYALPGSGKDIDPQVTLHANLSDGEAVRGTHLVNFEEKWSANGIIVENERIGYRALMSPPYAFDIIGKNQSKMLTSPVKLDLQKLTEWGGDVLDEALSLGIGSPAIYDLDKIVPLSKFDSKEIRIVEAGPLRAEVHFIIKGVPVRNEKVDFLLKWQMQAGKLWAQMELSIISKTDLNLLFAFGLPRHDEATDFTQGLLDEVHFAYTYGLQSAQGEPLGMAIMVPGKYEVDTYRDDPHNHFYLVSPIDQGVQYRVISAGVKGSMPIYDEVMFLDLIRKQTVEYGARVEITPDFGL